jgi:prepilin-type N-terminal cleavage/methylation domain-containing protein/prepilin-type processing-associated H-X9-DG protein
MKRAGFTLPELLIVIFIISLLMAILLPFLIGSRKYAHQVLCSFNIKQSVYGLSMYETDYKMLPYSLELKDMLGVPPPGGYPGSARFDLRGWWWFNYISVYFPKEKGEKIFTCPARNITSPTLEKHILYGNYGVNMSLCKRSRTRRITEFRGAPLNRSDISSPEQTMLIVDCGYAMINWHHAADEPPVELDNRMGHDTAYIPGLKINKDRKLISGQETDAIEGRHTKKTVNAGFADGHIARHDADYFLVEKIKDDEYENKSPLWAPKK